MATSISLRARLQALLPDRYREAGYRIVVAVSTFLLSFSLVTTDQATLWTQLGLGTVTLLFAALNSTSAARTALYAILGPLGAVLQAYAIVNDVRWALIATAVGQLFGTATAAAKTVQATPQVDPFLAS